MPSSPASLVSILWFLEILAEAYLVCVVFRFRKEWTAFYVYIAFHLSWNLSIYGIFLLDKPSLFFYSYWWGRAALFLFECAAVGFVLSKILRPVRGMPAPILIGGVITASTICAIGWYISGTVASKRYLPITRFVLSAERGLTTVEAIAILFFIGIASLLALRWHWTESLVTAGFVCQALATMLSAALFSTLPGRYTDLVQIGVQVTDLLTFGIWIAAFPSPSLQLSFQACGHTERDSLMIWFTILFASLCSIFLLWVFTTHRRLKGRGLLALQDMVDVPIDQAQMIALKLDLEKQIARHQAVWDSIGGFTGLLNLHHNAACLIEVWSEVSLGGIPGTEDLDWMFYGLGLCVALAGLEALLNKPFRWFGRKEFTMLPKLHATFAVTLYAEIQVQLRTLCEAYRPDLLAMIGHRI